MNWYKLISFLYILWSICYSKLLPFQSCGLWSTYWGAFIRLSINLKKCCLIFIRITIDPKNLTLPTGGSNWPPLIQKHHVTNRGVQLTSFDPQTSCYQQGGPTDLLWSKNVTLPTGGSNWPFRCLDAYFVCVLVIVIHISWVHSWY